MTKEEVSEAVEIFHLHISPSQHVRLLVILNETDCNVSLFNRHFLRLARDDADYIAKFALHRKLADSTNNKLSLHGCN